MQKLEIQISHVKIATRYYLAKILKVEGSIVQFILNLTVLLDGA